jgi:hypothetical protein
LRALRREHAKAIKDRDVPGLHDVLIALDEIARERGVGPTWSVHTAEGARLALTARPRDEHLVRPENLAELDKDSRALLGQFNTFAKARSWSTTTTAAHERTLRLLLTHLGPHAPLRQHFAAPRLLGFLRDRGLLAAPPPMTDTSAAATRSSPSCPRPSSMPRSSG